MGERLGSARPLAATWAPASVVARGLCDRHFDSSLFGGAVVWPHHGSSITSAVPGSASLSHVVSRGSSGLNVSIAFSSTQLGGYLPRTDAYDDRLPLRASCHLRDAGRRGADDSGADDCPVARSECERVPGGDHDR